MNHTLGVGCVTRHAHRRRARPRLATGPWLRCDGRLLP
jgi:hypothetical protein